MNLAMYGMSKCSTATCFCERLRSRHCASGNMSPRGWTGGRPPCTSPSPSSFITTKAAISLSTWLGRAFFWFAEQRGLPWISAWQHTGCPPGIGKAAIYPLVGRAGCARLRSPQPCQLIRFARYGCFDILPMKQLGCGSVSGCFVLTQREARNSRAGSVVDRVKGDSSGRGQRLLPRREFDRVRKRNHP